MGHGFTNLQYLVWPDVPAEAFAQLHAHQPQLKIIASPDPPLRQKSSRRPRLPPEADPRVPLDQPHADAIAQFDWVAAAAARAHPGGPEAGLGSGASASDGAGSGRQELTLAERFRCFNVQNIESNCI